MPAYQRMTVGEFDQGFLAYSRMLVGGKTGDKALTRLHGMLGVNGDESTMIEGRSLDSLAKRLASQGDANGSRLSSGYLLQLIGSERYHNLVAMERAIANGAVGRHPDKPYRLH